MSSTLSPFLVNIYMEAFERKLRFAQMLNSSTAFFGACLNGAHTDAKFTMELEKDSTLPFLDVLVSRRPDGLLEHRVYRKPTHTD
ncbi:hypothetical protein NQ315_013790 [Exocentrus adspersus]|uniref:BTB domain-containing protein n=1 Tax=Exocentrus adspersus TaxID=1586481 RepID=A0AAV8W3T6_9CUCU|nr:hypothetical protein NQ315_013790 [Exocentrus adspersus]